MRNKDFIQVAAAVIELHGRYLITQREPEVHLGGFWEFPGGKREPEETLEACVARELLEELGIEVTNLVPFRVIPYEYPDKFVELHFFSCSLLKGQPRPIGCTDFRWVKPDELADFSFPPADWPVVTQLLELAKVHGT